LALLAVAASESPTLPSPCPDPALLLVAVLEVRMSTDGSGIAASSRQMVCASSKSCVHRA
jgi:hypothetical protein